MARLLTANGWHADEGTILPDGTVHGEAPPPPPPPPNETMTRGQPQPPHETISQAWVHRIAILNEGITMLPDGTIVRHDLRGYFRRLWSGFWSWAERPCTMSQFVNRGAP